MINLLGAGVEAQVIESIREADPDLAQKIADSMFVFDDMMKLDDKWHPAAAQGSADRVADRSRSRAPRPSCASRFLRNMSSRAAETLREDLESRGPMRLSEVEAEQKEILKIVRRLADEGQIVLGGRAMATSSSHRWQRRDLPSQAGPSDRRRGKTQAYSRFIPREELAGFAAWSPARSKRRAEPADALHRPMPPRGAQRWPPQASTAAVARRPPRPPPRRRPRRRASRAIRTATATAWPASMPSSRARRQASAQIGALTQAYDRQLDALQAQLADALARARCRWPGRWCAASWRSVPNSSPRWRATPSTRCWPSARQVTLRVHPDDQRFVAEGAGEALAGRAAHG